MDVQVGTLKHHLKHQPRRYSLDSKQKHTLKEGQKKIIWRGNHKVLKLAQSKIFEQF